MLVVVSKARRREVTFGKNENVLLAPRGEGLGQLGVLGGTNSELVLCLDEPAEEVRDDSREERWEAYFLIWCRDTPWRASSG